MPKITRDMAERILAETQGDKRFFVCDGTVLSSLDQVPDAIKAMDEGAFEQHVNGEKNDFANWIGDVMGDNELANTIRKLKSKMAISRKVSERVKTLQKVAA